MLDMLGDGEAVGENVMVQVWDALGDVLTLKERVRENEPDPVREGEKLSVRLSEPLSEHEKVVEWLPVRLNVEVKLGESEDVLLHDDDGEPVEDTVPVQLVVTLLVVETLSEGLPVKLREKLLLWVAEPEGLMLSDWLAVRLQEDEMVWLPVGLRLVVPLQVWENERLMLMVLVLLPEKVPLKVWELVAEDEVEREPVHELDAVALEEEVTVDDSVGVSDVVKE